MKIRSFAYLLSAVALSAVFSPLKAQTPTLEYDLGFTYGFDNREFANADVQYTRSRTYHVVIFNPQIGVGVAQSDSIKHRFMFGNDHVRNMGNDGEFFHEVTAFYNGRVQLPKGKFEAAAGVFPRSMRRGVYSEAFLSDSLSYMDSNLDGMLLMYENDKFYSELGLDWMGMKSQTRKERFEIFSAGNYQFLPWLSAGWSASFYHFAGSYDAPGVCDNHLIEPYLKLDLSNYVGLQKLTFQAGAYLSYQRDRERDATATYPCGLELVANAQHRSLGIQNTLYAGRNLMPYYSGIDLAGAKYCNRLYRGSPFYQQRMYNLLECYWQPYISEYLMLRVSGRFHFGSADGNLGSASYLGCQQVIFLIFNLEALNEKKR